MKENGTATQEIKIVRSDAFHRSKDIARVLIEHPDKLFDMLIVVAQWLDRLKYDKGRMGRLYQNGMLLVSVVQVFGSGKYRILSWKRLTLAVAALVYLITIPDLIPDLLPVIGLLDDIGLVTWVAGMLKREVDKAIIEV